MLRVLVTDKCHTEAGLPSSLACKCTCSCVSICFWHSELADLVLEVRAAEAPKAHVLDTTSHERSRAPRIEVDVFDLER